MRTLNFFIFYFKCKKKVDQFVKVVVLQLQFLGFYVCVLLLILFFQEDSIASKQTIAGYRNKTTKERDRLLKQEEMKSLGEFQYKGYTKDLGKQKRLNKCFQFLHLHFLSALLIPFFVSKNCLVTGKWISLCLGTECF